MQVNKRKTLLSLAALILTITVIVSGSHVYSQNGSSGQQSGSASTAEQERQTWYMREKQNPTPIEEGKLTARQKEHSKLYTRYSKGSKKLPGSTGWLMGGGEIYLPSPFNLRNHLTSMACEADAVVIGTLKNEASQLTEDEAFIFTDYDLTLEEVIKNNPSSPLTVGNDIAITRAGGAILLNGEIINVRIEAFRIFRVNERYLLFLKYVPSTGAYQAFAPGSFWLNNGKVIGMLAMESIPATTDEIDFLQKVRLSAISDCKGKPTQLLK